jgi:hypothetical protein
MTSSGGTSTWRFETEPVRSTQLGGQSVWSSEWQRLDNEAIRARRREAIRIGLPRDARYAPNLDRFIEQ